MPRDWALVAVLVSRSMVETVLREDLASRPLVLLAVLTVLAPLLRRRTHPLGAVAVSFGTWTAVDVVRILAGDGSGLPTAGDRAVTLPDPDRLRAAPGSVNGADQSLRCFATYLLTHTPAVTCVADIDRSGIG